MEVLWVYDEAFALGIVCRGFSLCDGTTDCRGDQFRASHRADSKWPCEGKACAGCEGF
jgi:hypothetical protein